MSRLAGIFAIVACVAAPSLRAQAPERTPRPDDIPAAQRPPAGMCRLWIDGVPAGRQPAPTDCATAIRRRPPNARVVFGDDVRPSTPEREPEGRAPRVEPPGESAKTPLPIPQLRPRVEPAPSQPKPQPPVVRTEPPRPRPRPDPVEAERQPSRVEPRAMPRTEPSRIEPSEFVRPAPVLRRDPDASGSGTGSAVRRIPGAP